MVDLREGSRSHWLFFFKENMDLVETICNQSGTKSLRVSCANPTTANNPISYGKDWRIKNKSNTDQRLTRNMFV